MIKKIFVGFSAMLIASTLLFGQEIQESSNDFFSGSNNNDDALFGGSDDDLFGGITSDDDLFGGITTDDELFGGSDDELFGNIDDGIEELDTTAKSDLSKGVLFEAGSIKIGGSFRTGINTNTVLYNPKQTDFGKNIKDTTFTPDLSAFLTFDARPTNNLRMYTKFGINYPFKSNVMLNLTPLDLIAISKGDFSGLDKKITVKDWFSLKELFTDFSVKDTAFFRFGVHTVTWGAGYFFSPISDIINTSSIDPQNPTEQVNGSLNLRTQIIFPDTTNCLWLYVIPSNDFANVSSAQSYLRDTALAAKYDFVIGGWELGLGGFWKYQNAPKLTFTANGSIKKLSLFAELVYQYGATTEWVSNKDSWEDKKHIIQATIGGFYTWKTPGIMLGMQYYYDGNDKDFMNRMMTNGHNIALMANFNKFGKVDKLTASLFAMVNFGKAGLTSDEKKLAEGAQGSLPELPCLIANANLSYALNDNIRFSMGPGVTFTSWDEKPVVNFKIGATLGGGKF